MGGGKVSRPKRVTTAMFLWKLVLLGGHCSTGEGRGLVLPGGSSGPQSPYRWLGVCNDVHSASPLGHRACRETMFEVS